MSIALSTPVYVLEREMPSSVFSEYVRYNSIAPFGSERDNLHAGIIAASVANSGFNRSKEDKISTDFLLRTKQEKEEYENWKTELKEKQKAEKLMSFMMGMDNG